jgi:secondary thiamine-phosphate synthase enzyme
LENKKSPSARQGDFGSFFQQKTIAERMKMVWIGAKRNKVRSQSGNCDRLVNAMHITASVFINDNESGLLHDYEEWLEGLAPHDPVGKYWHNRTGEDNADAHIKRQVMGREVVVAVTEGRLDFGPWEQIFYGEFDGYQRKRVLVKIIGE